MDAIDRNIIRQLQENARVTNIEISNRVGLSPPPCLRRIRRLEDRGVIVGYTAIIDQKLLGLDITAFVQIRLEKMSTDCADAFEKEIEEVESVIECHLITGPNHYLLHVVCENQKQYENLVRNKLMNIPGVAHMETSFSLGDLTPVTQPPLM